MVRFTPLRPPLWKLALVSAALFALPFSSRAGVIVSVTDLATPVNRASLFLGGEFSNVAAVSWTESGNFPASRSMLHSSASIRVLIPVRPT